MTKVEILLNGKSVTAFVLDYGYMTGYSYNFQCISDGYDNDSQNELDERLVSEDDGFYRVLCRAKNGRNEKGWLEQQFDFVKASKLISMDEI